MLDHAPQTSVANALNRDDVSLVSAVSAILADTDRLQSLLRDQYAPVSPPHVKLALFKALAGELLAEEDIRDAVLALLEVQLRVYGTSYDPDAAWCAVENAEYDLDGPLMRARLFVEAAE